jgi:hypothetical protein
MSLMFWAIGAAGAGTVCWLLLRDRGATDSHSRAGCGAHHHLDDEAPVTLRHSNAFSSGGEVRLLTCRGGESDRDFRHEPST